MIKKIILVLVTLIPTWIKAEQYKATERICLDKNWQFAQAGKNEWMPAKVHGTVHQNLIDNGKLIDPFWGMNEEKVQWVEKEDWKYKTSFVITKEQLEYSAAMLRFEGLDTYADIYLNGALIKRTDNMFVGYDIQVKELLHEGENHLQVYFHSPIKQTLPQLETDGFSYPADNDHSEQRVSIYSRKAPYSYGWDWGIRLATSGIWRPVSLIFYDAAYIDDLYVEQLEINSSKAKINHHFEIFHPEQAELRTEISVTYSYKDKVSKTESLGVTLKHGTNLISIPLEIDAPKLWMPNGWGEASLYKLDATVKADGVTVASQSKLIGLRDIKVVMEDDNDGKSFYFMVNGQPMFAKGSNFIPDDALLPNVTPERYTRLMQDVKDANHNMIRVWGGGIYEDEKFYEAADKMGILVWQDFIFACTTYPSDSVFLNRVKDEAEYNIRRLRNHASLAMWCGNNEIYEGMRYWGWSKKYEPDVWQRMQQGYNKIFHNLLPAMVEMYDKGRFYMHSSPYEANWGRPESWKIADSHNWGIWYGQKPFESLDNEIPRFMSEYGFQSFPEMKTIASFASPKDYALESEVMNAHQKATIGNALIKKTMALYYDEPKDFEELVYKGLVLQGFGIRHGIEAHRRNRPFCMGTLYWQLNDSWPVVSWSGIDYFGNWKALHYQTQRAYAPLLLNAVREGDSITVYAISDKLESYKNASLELRLKDFNGKTLKKMSVKNDVPSNSSVRFHILNYKEMAVSPANTFLQMTLKSASGELLSKEIYYFCYPKEQALPATDIRYKIRQEDGRCEISLKAGQLARDVFIEIPFQGARFSDNFFDLLPGESKKVTITSPQIKQDGQLTLKIRHLKNIIHINN